MQAEQEKTDKKGLIADQTKESSRDQCIPNFIMAAINQKDSIFVMTELRRVELAVDEGHGFRPITDERAKGIQRVFSAVRILDRLMWEYQSDVALPD